MEETIRGIDPTSDPEWDHKLLDWPEAGFFHTSAWAETLRHAYGYRLFHAVLEDGDRLLACLPMAVITGILTGRRAVALPFSDHCAPLARGKEAFQCLWRWLIARGGESGWKTIEVRGGEKFFRECPPYQVFDRHFLDLSRSEANLYARLRPATRRNLKRADREGVRVRCSATDSALRRFYRLNVLTRRRHGLPPQPWRFFRAFHEKVLVAGRGDLLLAHWRDRVIAGAVYVRFGTRVTYKYGASDPLFQDKRGNDAVMWQAIRRYHGQGAESLDFGRTGRDNAGLRHYKEGWGAVVTPLAYYRYRLDRRTYDRGSGNEFHAYNRIFSRLPLWMLRAIGEALYGQVG